MTSPASSFPKISPTEVPDFLDGVSVRRMKPLSLTRNAFWTTLGTGTYAAAQWAQIILIARLGTSADVGRYALALAVCAPVFMLFNFQLRQIQATDCTRKHSFPEYLGLRLISSGVAFGVICVLACFWSHSSSAVALTIAVGVFKSIESVSDIYQGLLQQYERMDYVGRSLLLKSGLMLIGFGGTYYGTHNLVLAVSAMVCAQFAGSLIYDIRSSYLTTGGRHSGGWFAVIRIMGQANFRMVPLGRLAVRALPLGLAMMLLSLYTSLPRFVLNKYMGPAAIGVFAALAYVPLASGLMVNAVGTAAAPRLSQSAKTDLVQFHKLLSKQIVFAAALGAVGVLGSILFGRPLLQLLYGFEYARYFGVLIWIMLAGALNYLASTFGFAATARGQFAGQPLVVGVAIAIMLVSAIALVPTRGLAGVAIATVLAAFACLCGYAVLAFR